MNKKFDLKQFVLTKETTDNIKKILDKYPELKDEPIDSKLFRAVYDKCIDK